MVARQRATATGGLNVRFPNPRGYLEHSAVAPNIGPTHVWHMTSFVVPHNPMWKAAFECEARAISTVIGQGEIALHHIGSTAIPDILAKPIIDLLGIVSKFDVLNARSIEMETLGYEVMGAFGIEGRRYFRKIDTTGQRTHHLHVYETGSAHIDRHLAFRDYLQRHPRVAKEYSDLKASLIKGTTPTLDAYMDGKDPFIATVEKEALRWYHQKQ